MRLTNTLLLTGVLTISAVSFALNPPVQAQTYHTYHLVIISPNLTPCLLTKSFMTVDGKEKALKKYVWC